MHRILDSKYFALGTLVAGTLGLLLTVRIAYAEGPQTGQLCDTEAKAYPRNVIIGPGDPLPRDITDWEPWDPNDVNDGITCTVIDCVDICAPESWVDKPAPPGVNLQVTTCGCAELPPGFAGPGSDPPVGEPETDFCTIVAISEINPLGPNTFLTYSCWGSCPPGPTCQYSEGSSIWDENGLLWAYISCYCQ